jgi:hypothetical protein
MSHRQSPRYVPELGIFLDMNDEAWIVAEGSDFRENQQN